MSSPGLCKKVQMEAPGVCDSGKALSLMSLNLTFRLGCVSEMTLQSWVAFNYRHDSASRTASQPARLAAWSNLEPQQNRADLETKALTFLRDSSRTAVWGLHQLSFLAPDSGACNIQHIFYTANIFWTVSEPVKIHPFPALEAGLHPGLIDILWKNMRERRGWKGKFHYCIGWCYLSAIKKNSGIKCLV